MRTELRKPNLSVRSDSRLAKPEAFRHVATGILRREQRSDTHRAANTQVAGFGEVATA